jgi:hypothetical protein
MGRERTEVLPQPAATLPPVRHRVPELGANWGRTGDELGTRWSCRRCGHWIEAYDGDQVIEDLLEGEDG